MQSQKAFSLMEMLLTFTVMSILTAITVPYLLALRESTEDKLLFSQVQNALSAAREEASIRRYPVSVCQSADGIRCAEKQVRYLILFLDRAHLGYPIDQHQILAAHPLTLHGGTLVWRAFPFYRQAILFLPSGLLVSDNGTFWHCHTGLNKPRWGMTLNKTAQTHRVTLSEGC